MPGESALATVPITGLAGLVVVHLFLVRILGTRGFLVPFLMAFLVGGLLGGVLNTLALRSLQKGPADAVALSLLNGLAYLALGFVYFNLVNMNLTSLRIRLLRELLERQPTGVGRDELMEKYGPEEILMLRLERLTRSGHLVRRGGRYYTGKRGIVLIAMVFDFLKRLILPRKSSDSSAPSRFRA